jgi:polyphosphate kinase
MSEQTDVVSSETVDIQPGPDNVSNAEADALTPSPAVKSPQVPIPKAVAPEPVPEDAELTHPSLYFNMELSWIDFNWRVLHLALDERTPLLERVRFVAITASNLDEFVQKRIGGLKRQEAAGVRKLSPDGRTPTQQLNYAQECHQRDGQYND